MTVVPYFSSLINKCTKLLSLNFHVRVKNLAPRELGRMTKSPTLAFSRLDKALLRLMFLNFGWLIFLGIKLPKMLFSDGFLG